MKHAIREMQISQETCVAWALHLHAVSAQEPARLVQLLAGAILGCGGWVLSRRESDDGVIHILFEFERKACVDIYGVLVAAGVELTRAGHIRLTELCHCTRNQRPYCEEEIASIDLEIQTYVHELAVLEQIASAA